MLFGKLKLSMKELCIKQYKLIEKCYVLRGTINRKIIRKDLSSVIADFPFLNSKIQQEIIVWTLLFLSLNRTQNDLEIMIYIKCELSYHTTCKIDFLFSLTSSFISMYYLDVVVSLLIHRHPEEKCNAQLLAGIIKYWNIQGTLLETAIGLYLNLLFSRQIGKCVPQPIIVVLQY